MLYPEQFADKLYLQPVLAFKHMQPLGANRQVI